MIKYYIDVYNKKEKTHKILDNKYYDLEGQAFTRFVNYCLNDKKDDEYLEVKETCR